MTLFLLVTGYLVVGLTLAAIGIGFVERYTGLEVDAPAVVAAVTVLTWPVLLPITVACMGCKIAWHSWELCWERFVGCCQERYARSKRNKR